MIPQYLHDAVSEAERRLAHMQRRISKPSATIEDEYDYQKARASLAVAECNVWKAEAMALRSALRNKPMTKPDQQPKTRAQSARERAEAVLRR